MILFISIGISGDDTVTWTFEEGLKFDCARDLLTSMIGMRSAMIAEETAKQNPDFDLVAKFKADRFVFARRRESFHVRDIEKIEAIFDEFSEVVRDGYSYECSVSFNIVR